MKTKVYNLKGEAVAEADLPENIFGSKWNPDLVHQVLLAQIANRHGLWAHAKGRGEVSGGGRKPWKQKHTGRARHGSIRSPIWRGGGVTHGPNKNRNYEQKINKKMVRAALHSLLSRKLADGEVKVVDSLNLETPKTKILFSGLKSILSDKKISAVVVRSSENKLLARAARNIPKIIALDANSLNVDSLLKHKNVLIEQRAVSEIK
ncbi:MAG: 50S ribosomal protein L4 [Patescibacteria group bacterium]